MSSNDHTQHKTSDSMEGGIQQNGGAVNQPPLGAASETGRTGETGEKPLLVEITYRQSELMRIMLSNLYYSGKVFDFNKQVSFNLLLTENDLKELYRLGNTLYDAQVATVLTKFR